MPDPKYYDPVKAHEYYMKTRELKGRAPAKLKGDKQKQAWAYSQSRIKEEKKQRLEDIRIAQKSSYDKVRAKANDRRTEIRDRVARVLQSVSEASKAKRINIAKGAKAFNEAVSRRAQAQIDSLPKAPKGLSKEARIKFNEERAKKIAQIRGEARSDRDKINTASRSQRDKITQGTKAIRDTIRTNIKAERQRVADDAKSSIEKYRGIYQDMRTEVIEKYKRESEQEREAISKTVKKR